MASEIENSREIEAISEDNITVQKSVAIQAVSNAESDDNEPVDKVSGPPEPIENEVPEPSTSTESSSSVQHNQQDNDASSDDSFPQEPLPILMNTSTESSTRMHQEQSENESDDNEPAHKISGSPEPIENEVPEPSTSTESSSSVQHNQQDNDASSEDSFPQDLLSILMNTSTESSTSVQQEQTENDATSEDNPSEPLPVIIKCLANVVLEQPNEPDPIHTPESSSNFVGADDEPSSTTGLTACETEANKESNGTTAPTADATTITTAKGEPDSTNSHTCENLLNNNDRETRPSDDDHTTDDEDGSCMTIADEEPGSVPPGTTHTLIADEPKTVQKECGLCGEMFPVDEIVLMLKCTHTWCRECTKGYFTHQVTNGTISDCICPFCKEPDLNGPDVTEDDLLEYFSNLDIFLRRIVDETIHALFQQKLRDRTLAQDPNFKWCVNCTSGFIALPKQRQLACPDCGSITCASCRKPWESQHEALSCEKYAEWKEANNPQLQAEGVQRHLQTHGIRCPNCKCWFEMVRGGCMHFTCTQCMFEFCYGCNKPFMIGARCRGSSHCAGMGLHAHHPRNCLFYLRDKEPWELQSLLTMHNVPFDMEPSKTTSVRMCSIPLSESVCSAEVPEKHAGLCRTHYIEYLVGTVSKARIDPLPILDLNDCMQELRRRGIPLPARGPYDTDQIYREMCQKVIKDKIPLN